MTNTVNEYLVYCIAEDKDVSAWGPDPPTLCPNNHLDRTIDPNRTRLINTISTRHMKVTEDLDGYYHCDGISFNIAAGPIDSITTHDLIWPYNIVIWNTDVYCTSDNVGDVVSVVAAPNKLIGNITSPVTIGSNTIVVSTTVTGAVYKSFSLTIDDGVNSQDLGRIISIDTTTNTITIENSLTNDYATGSLIKLNVNLITDFEIALNGIGVSFGSKGLRGKPLPANTTLRTIYKNKNGLAKKTIWRIEYFVPINTPVS